MPILLSETAAKEIKKIIVDQQLPAVVGGHCSAAGVGPVGSQSGHGM